MELSLILLDGEILVAFEDYQKELSKVWLESAMDFPQDDRRLTHVQNQCDTYYIIQLQYNGVDPYSSSFTFLSMEQNTTP